jgi:hypothetical protein
MQLLTAANLAKLDDAEVAIWEQALNLIPKMLAAPAVGGPPVIDVTPIPIEVEPGAVGEE